MCEIRPSPYQSHATEAWENSKNKDLATMNMILALRPRLVISLRLPKKRKNCFHVMWLVENKKKKRPDSREADLGSDLAAQVQNVLLHGFGEITLARVDVCHGLSPDVGKG